MEQLEQKQEQQQQQQEQQQQQQQQEEDHLILLLKSSLESNLVLQQSIKKQIQLIQTKKINNRLSVLQLTNQLQQQVQQVQVQVQVQVQQQCKKNNDVLQQQQKIQIQWNHIQNTINTTAMNSNRSKWTRRFFYCNDTSTKLNELQEPTCNNDTLLRQQYYNNNFFYYNITPPWSKKESLQLQTIIDKNNNTTIQNNLDFIIITQQYNEQINNQRTKECFPEKKQQQSILYIHRTIYECKVRYIELLLLQRQKQHNTKWTKDESKVLQDIVMKNQKQQQQQQHNQKQDNNTIEIYVDWDTIAKIFCESLQLSSSAASSLEENTDQIDNNNNTKSNKKRKLNNNNSSCNIVIPYRLGYECMKQYQQITLLSSHSKVTNSTSSSTWTILEDTILLKLLSLYGNQYTIDGKAIDLYILQNIFTCHGQNNNKTKYQILFRCNTTLLNPKLSTTGWTITDERKLVVLMKLYSTSTNDTNSTTNNTINDIYLSALHYKDTKCIKSVIDKWNRTLNPNYTLQSYSTEEDELLHSIIQSKINKYEQHNQLQQQQSQQQQQESNNVKKYPENNNNNNKIIPILSWTQIQEQYFPNRHPQRLCDHYYNTIASNSDILQLYNI